MSDRCQECSGLNDHADDCGYLDREASQDALDAAVALEDATTAAQVTINRSLLVNRVGSRTPASWLYEVTGPDGHQFDNKSISELRRLLHRRYGRNVIITQNWEGPARGVRWSDMNANA